MIEQEPPNTLRWEMLELHKNSFHTEVGVLAKIYAFPDNLHQLVIPAHFYKIMHPFHARITF